MKDIKELKVLGGEISELKILSFYKITENGLITISWVCEHNGDNIFFLLKRPLGVDNDLKMYYLSAPIGENNTLPANLGKNHKLNKIERDHISEQITNFKKDLPLKEESPFLNISPPVVNKELSLFLETSEFKVLLQTHRVHYSYLVMILLEFNDENMPSECYSVNILNPYLSENNAFNELLDMLKLEPGEQTWFSKHSNEFFDILKERVTEEFRKDMNKYFKEYTDKIPPYDMSGRTKLQ